MLKWKEEEDDVERKVAIFGDDDDDANNAVAIADVAHSTTSQTSKGLRWCS